MNPFARLFISHTLSAIRLCPARWFTVFSGIINPHADLALARVSASSLSRVRINRLSLSLALSLSLLANDGDK